MDVVRFDFAISANSTEDFVEGSPQRRQLEASLTASTGCVYPVCRLVLTITVDDGASGRRRLQAALNIDVEMVILADAEGAAELQSSVQAATTALVESEEALSAGIGGIEVSAVSAVSVDEGVTMTVAVAPPPPPSPTPLPPPSPPSLTLLPPPSPGSSTPAPPASAPTPPPSGFSVQIAFTASGSVEEYTDEVRATVLDVLAGLAGFDSTPPGATLTVTAASVNVVATLPVASETAAETASAAISTAVASAADLGSRFTSAGLSFTVESAPVASVVSSEAGSSWSCGGGCVGGRVVAILLIVVVVTVLVFAWRKSRVANAKVADASVVEMNKTSAANPQKDDEPQRADEPVMTDTVEEFKHEE